MPRREHACVFGEIDEEGIAWVTLNRPEKRNAMSPQLHYDMESVMMEIETCALPTPKIPAIAA